MNIPKDCKYSKEHEWVRFDGESALVGITDHAQSSLGDIVHVELPGLGKALKFGDIFGSVESVKAVSDLYSAVDGVVSEINAEVQKNPAILNLDPHGKGWLIKLKLSNMQPNATLMDAASYANYLKSMS